MLAACGGPADKSEHHVSATPACPDCSIEMVPIVGLGDETDPEILDDWAQITPLGSGSIIATTSRGSALIEYDMQGRYIRAFGKSGDGPGELRNRSSVYARGGHLFVDRGDGRTLRFDSGGSVVSEMRIPQRCRVAMLPETLLCVGYRDDSVGKPGRAFHVWNTATGPVSSFGDRSRGQPFDCPLCRSVVWLDEAGDSVFWAAEWPQYRLQQWTLGGRRLASLTIGDSVEFENGRIESSLLGPSGIAGINAVVPHNGDSVWIARSVDTSTAHYDLYRSGEWTPGKISAQDLQASSITILELVSASTGVVARTTLPGVILAGYGKDMLWSKEELPTGGLRVLVWRANLVVGGK